MSGNYRSRSKTSSYRDALYATLEAAVREDTKSEGVTVGDINNAYVGEERVSCTTACVEYPSPFLWYEEMTPADVDAYHARHVNVNRGNNSNRYAGSTQQGESSGAGNRSPGEGVSSAPDDDDAYRELHSRARGSSCNAVAAAELAEARREMTRRQTSEEASSARPSSSVATSMLQPSHNPYNSHQQHVAGLINTTRRASQEVNEPVQVGQQRSHGEGVIDGSSADDVRSRWFLTGALSCGVEPFPTTALAAIGKAASSSSPICQTRLLSIDPAASSKDRPPVIVDAAIKSSQAVAASEASVRTLTTSQEQPMAAPMRTSSSRKPPASQVTPTPDDGGREETEEEEEEKEERAQTTSSYHRIVASDRNKQETLPTTTLPPPPPPPCSQLTQQSVLFQPDLPSQVLVTQQQGGAEWDHDQHAVEGEEEEEETPMSEYGLSFPVSQSYRDPPAPDVGNVQEVRSGCELFGDRGAHKEGWDKRAHDGAGDGMVVVSSGRGGGKSASSFPARQQEEEIHSLQHEAFSRALGALIGSEEACAGTNNTNNVAVESAAAQRSRGARGDHQSRQKQQQIVFVPTEEVLPRRHRGGQAGVCAFLEDHLSRARELAPKGYAARALELACHVLRQSKVCVRAEQEHDSVDRMLRNMESNEEALADGHAEVVGVSGFVWEIVRTAPTNYS